MNKIFMLLLMTSFSLLFGNPSFDCSKVTTIIEKSICQNTTLSKLDNDLNKIYLEIKKEKKDKFESVRKSQRIWISERNLCKDNEDISKCLTESYKNRIRYLKNINNESQVLNNMIEQMVQNYKDEQKITLTETSEINTCEKPSNLNNTNVKNISIKEQRKILFDYTKKWNTFIDCETKKIYETSSNVEELYNLVKDDIECNPGFTYVFNEWDTSVTSERTLYSVLSNCNLIDIEKKLFFIQKTLPEKDISQQKWEEYFTSVTGIKNINNLNSLNELHPYDSFQLSSDISKLLKNRIEDIYSLLCEKDGLEIKCSERKFKKKSLNNNIHKNEKTFSNEIKRILKEKDLIKLYSLFDGELSNGPRRKDVINGNFNDFFTDEWLNKVLNGEVTKVGYKGYMISNGLIWFDKFKDNKWSIVSFNDWIDINKTNNKLWKVSSQIVSPNCFSYPWDSMDNYEEYQEKFNIKDKMDFINNPGKYFGKNLNMYDSLTPSWSDSKNDTISLSYNLDNCLIDESKLSNNRLLNDYGYTEYELFKKLPIKVCKTLSPNIKSDCLECNIIKVIDDMGGSKGPVIEYGVYGLYNVTEKSNKYIVPLDFLGSKNHTLNFIDKVLE